MELASRRPRIGGRGGALGAGADEAEAYASRRPGARSASTAARSRASPPRPSAGIGVRAWIGGRVGYAYGTDLTEPALRAVAESAAVSAAAVADADEFAGPPEPGGEPKHRRACATPRSASGRPSDVVELALAVERAALDRTTTAITGVEQAVYADAPTRGRDPLLDRHRGRLRGVERLRLPAGAGRRRAGRRRPASASASAAAPAALDAGRDRRRGGRAGRRR